MLVQRYRVQPGSGGAGGIPWRRARAERMADKASVRLRPGAGSGCARPEAEGWARL
jgi:hypothetical protein